MPETRRPESPDIRLRNRHWADASGETVVVVGLPPGQHKVLIKLADPTHKVITSETVTFVVPDLKPVANR